MKRLWITLLIIAMAVVITVPAGAGDINCDDPLSKPYTPDHPTCNPDDPTTTTSTTTTTTTVPQESEDCVFEGGVLRWNPPEYLRCRWTVPSDERNKTFHFSLELVPEVEGATVNLPHLIVTDVFPYGGQICFNEYAVGWNPLPYLWAEFTLPPTGLCTGGGGDAVDGEPDVFAITIDAIKIKKGAVQLTYFTTG